MKDLTCEERIGMINGKVKEVLQLISEVEQGEKVDYNEITAQILDIHRDELRLVRILHEYENQDSNLQSLDCAGIELVRQRGLA